MEIGYIMLIAICVIALVVLMVDITAVLSNRYYILKIVCIMLFVFTMLRYFTLIVYGDAPAYQQIMVLRYFYLASSIGLTIPTVSAIWYVTPLYREKISYPRYLLYFTPWIIFYMYIIIRQPTVVVQGESFGYALHLIDRYPMYLSIAQGSFIAIVFILSIIGIMNYKNLQIRVQLLMIIMAQITLLLDGITYFIKIPHTFPRFTVSEVLGFAALIYAFSSKIIEVKGITNQ
ncbi:hypothetical protein [Cellulosilyticum sp. I15G10I2]|uniref:hypothetical protein n=1 Tax=Cellulosilyticum sp. I15G10I2 TaxID=1892843 RepID=UPI00085CDC45|nr:hypothetical protein [Cellulosilyticum sp. I15G10I2]